MVCDTNWFVYQHIFREATVELQPDLAKLKRGIFGQIYQDGLLEIMLGLSFIALGFAFQSLINSVFLLLLMFPGIKLLEKIKVRFTYPRTGFFTLRKADYKPSHWKTLVYILCVVSSGCLILYSTGGWNEPSQWAKWSPYLVGAIASGVPLATFNYYRSPRNYFYASVGIALGVFLSLVKSPPTIL